MGAWLGKNNACLTIPNTVLLVPGYKLRKFAIDMNCDGIESSGRPGWVKIFSNNGVRASWITYELPLTEEKLYV